MSDALKSNDALTHVAGTLLIEARAAFLNGAGLGAREDRTTTIHKSFRDGKNSVPYVSAQAWRRWLRNTLISETGWPPSEIRAIAWNPKGNTSKVAGQVNPVDYPEDDLFGYMRAAEGQGKRAAEAADEAEPGAPGDDAPEDEAGDTEATDTIAAVMRASPFATSVLASIRSDGWLGRDDGFVHVRSHDPDALELAEWVRTIDASDGDIEKDGKQKIGKAERQKLKKDLKGKPTADALTIVRKFAEKHGVRERLAIPHPESPLPYSTRFFNTDLEGIFCLDHARVGIFWNIGDRKELDPHRVDLWQRDAKIEVVEDRKQLGKIYRLKDRTLARSRSRALIKSLAVLRGGAKQAAFATDVAPKALVLAGLSCGNPIFNHLFREGEEGPRMDVNRLEEIVRDYRERIVTPVFVGVRAGYLINEDEVRALAPTRTDPTKDDRSARASFVVSTPVEAANYMADRIP